MRRRDFIKGLGAAAVTAMALPRDLWAADAKVELPNIILAMSDDQGWGDVSYNGLKQIKTANLDDMAATGVRFDRFYAAAPVCSPTRGSVLTGRHPFRYGVWTYGKPIRAQEVTLAQTLKAAGYTTGHFGKWHLNGVDGPGKPIRAEDPLNPGNFGFEEWLSVSNFFDLDWTFSRMGNEEKFTGDGSDIIVDETLKFIDRVAATKKPFFAVVWFGSPHLPHDPSPKDADAAGGNKYYGEIVGLDRAMGALRAGLRNRGIADNTIVWFNSDNGAAADGSNGPFRGKKDTVYEGGLRVPGILEWPRGIKKPFATSIPVVTSDIVPTLLEITGAKAAHPERTVDGVSLVPLLNGKMTERPSPIGFWNLKAPERTKVAKEGLDKAVGHVALSDNRYKLHRLSTAKYELYDLASDAAEADDLSSKKVDTVAAMKQKLDAWQDSVIHSYNGGDY